MTKKIITPLLFKTYISLIKNSVGTKIFRNFYTTVNGRKTDVMENGNLSCAFFVSSILFLFKLIKRPHGTVDNTLKDMRKSGWTQIHNPKIGSILLWEKIKIVKGPKAHFHIGFYIGNKKAISNSSKKGYPIVHNWTFGTKTNKPKRNIEAIFWNRILVKAGL